MTRIARHWLSGSLAVTVLCVVLALAGAASRYGWQALWATSDQRGAWLLRQGQFDRAAETFDDPTWRGIALMRSGNFAEAVQAFAAADTAEATYDRGNALVMLGQYPDAVAQYDRALAVRPGWSDALANRTLAQTRADRFAHLQGEEADEEKAAPDETYHRDRKREDSGETAAQAPGAMSDQAIRELWLRRVQTKPADFLRARFAYQLQFSDETSAPAPQPSSGTAESQR